MAAHILVLGSFSRDVEGSTVAAAAVHNQSLVTRGFMRDGTLASYSQHPRFKLGLQSTRNLHVL